MSTVTIAGLEIPVRQTSRGPLVDADRPEMEALEFIVNIAVEGKLAEFLAPIERGEALHYNGLHAVPDDHGAYVVSGDRFAATLTLPAAALIEIMTTLTGMRVPPKPRVIPEPAEPDPPPPPRVAPPRPAGLATSLPELERRAAELDAMVARERTEEHLAEEARVRCWLLNDLQDFGLFDRDEYLTDGDDLPTLRGYRAAAVRLAQYLESHERAEHNPDAEPSLMLGAPVSVDWYRHPQRPGPSQFTEHGWLGFLEANLVSSDLYAGEHGTIIVNAGRGGWWTLHWRTDDGLHPAVVAATTSGA